MRLSQACGLRSEIIVEGSDGWEDREVKTDSSRRGGSEVGGFCQAGASKFQVNCCIRCRGDEGCGGEQPKEDGTRRQAGRLAGRRVGRPARACSRVVHTRVGVGDPG